MATCKSLVQIYEFYTLDTLASKISLAITIITLSLNINVLETWQTQRDTSDRLAFRGQQSRTSEQKTLTTTSLARVLGPQKETTQDSHNDSVTQRNGSNAILYEQAWKCLPEGVIDRVAFG